MSVLEAGLSDGLGLYSDPMRSDGRRVSVAPSGAIAVLSRSRVHFFEQGAETMLTNRDFAGQFQSCHAERRLKLEQWRSRRIQSTFE